jgi:hypothetical protein
MKTVETVQPPAMTVAAIAAGLDVKCTGVMYARRQLLLAGDYYSLRMADSAAEATAIFRPTTGIASGLATNRPEPFRPRPRTARAMIAAPSASSLDLSDDRRDVVVLFLRTESPNAIHDCGQQSLARQVPMLLKRFNQALLAKFLSSVVTGFGDAIGVKRKHVPRRKPLFAHRAIPLSEQPEQHAGGVEPIHLAVASYQQPRQMAAIDVAQSPFLLVVLNKQKRCIGTVAGVVIEEAVHRPEQRLGLIEGQRRLAPQAGLQIRHQ